MAGTPRSIRVIAREGRRLGQELNVTMALCGVKSIREIDRRVLADRDRNR
jgi:isopentenyl diphosphate isomerase/L-lactate dehydrogenase-like FMN-dependent dehydrogenase